MKIRASHRVLVLVLWLLGTGGGMSWSQNAFSPSHYIDIEVGGGVGGLGYELDGGRTLVAPSFSVGAGYTWFFLPIAGLQTGVRLTHIATTAMLTEPMEWRTAADDGRLRDYMGEEYTHRASFDSWKEREQMWLLQVPIGLRFRHFASTDARYGLHAAVGALLSVPLRSTYTLLSGEVTHTGWYEQWRLLLHDLPGRFETENYPRHDIGVRGSRYGHAFRREGTAGGGSIRTMDADGFCIDEIGQTYSYRFCYRAQSLYLYERISRSGRYG